MNPEFSSAGAPRLQWADAAAKLRFFYAVWPDATARSALAAAAADAARRTGGRPTRTANLHLTLAFVGAVPAERIDTLRTVGVAAAAAAAPCTFCLDHSGTFRDSDPKLNAVQIRACWRPWLSRRQGVARDSPTRTSSATLTLNTSVVIAPGKFGPRRDSHGRCRE